MQDLLARSFVVFILLLYASTALVFIVAAIRNFIWRPIIGKFAAQHPDRSYHRIKSASHEQSQP